MKVKAGLRLNKTFAVNYPSEQPFGAQFVFVGYFSDKMPFRFDQVSPSSSRHVTITVSSPLLQAQDSANRLLLTESSKNLPNLLNKKVVFTVKFEILGVLCNRINISDKQSYGFNFTPQNLRLTAVSFSPPKQGFSMFEFFGLNKGDDDDLLQKFFLQKIYRN